MQLIISIVNSLIHLMGEMLSPVTLGSPACSITPVTEEIVYRPNAVLK